MGGWMGFFLFFILGEEAPLFHSGFNFLSTFNNWGWERPGWDFLTTSILIISF